jgi:sulfate/thiosulfate transport system ATP-binding protein
MSIELTALHKSFGTSVVCDSIDLRVASGELLALVGPSGSGKTTLLRLIAGLEQADHGRLLLHGRDSEGQDVRERQIGFVFQHYALFNHLSVFDNVAFGLQVKPRFLRPSRTQIEQRVMELLQQVQLAALAGRRPPQLSGGQRQRVALARALAVQPRALLLDEPFGALDERVRDELRGWLRRLHDEQQLTTVFVTHDQNEAMQLADRVVVMNRGRIEQVGSAAELRQRPANDFVRAFLGAPARATAPAPA